MDKETINELNNKIRDWRKEKDKKISLEAIQLLEEKGGLVKLLELLVDAQATRDRENSGEIDTLRANGKFLLKQMGLYDFIYTYNEHQDDLNDERIQAFLQGVKFAQGQEWLIKRRW